MVGRLGMARMSCMNFQGEPQMPDRSIFVVMPFDSDFEDVYDAIREAAETAVLPNGQRIKVIRGDKTFGNNAMDEVTQAINGADLLIADASYDNPNVFMELGYADALGKPAIIINQLGLQVPFDISHRLVLFYDRKKLRHDLVPNLSRAIVSALKEPSEFIGKHPNRKIRKPKAFISYSHADSDCLSRMLVHLKPLEKQGILDVWSDRKINAGDKWRDQIEAALSESAVAVLLISADFLASDFIVDDELPPLLAAAETKGTRILPVILKPCRFSRYEHLSQFQAINNPGNPLLMLSEIEQEAIWDSLALAIENQIESYVPKAE